MNKPSKKILSLALAMLLTISPSPIFAAESSRSTTIGADDSIRLFQAEKILPDLSNLEAPPPSPARSGTRRPLELVSRDAALTQPLRYARQGLTRGTSNQDNPSMITGGQNLAKLVFFTGNFISGTVSTTNAFAPFSGTPLLPIVNQYTWNPLITTTLNADSTLATDLNQAISAMEFADYSAIGDISWVSSWPAHQVKVILTPLNVNVNNGMLLGYFDPNDFSGGANNNSDYYLYIDVSDFSGGGFDRYQNQRKQFIGTILREYAHMVNFSAGYAANSGMTNAQMQTWLDEAIATTVAYNYSETFERPYLEDFLEQDFDLNVGYVPSDAMWDSTNANYGAAALMMLDLTQYENPSAPRPMENLIHYNRINNSYQNSLKAVGITYQNGGDFNDFFTQFNLDVAVDNDPNDHAAALAALGTNFYGLDAIDYIWRERYDSNTNSYAGVTSLSPDTFVDVSTEFGNRSYYSHIYLTDTVGTDCSTVKIDVPSSSQTEYYLITPYDETDIDTDTEWQDCAKQAAILSPGANTVTVGTNNQFAVLAIQYGDTMPAGQSLAFTKLSSTKAITSFQLDGVYGTISGNNITVTLPAGVDVTNAAPTITHTGERIAPASGAAQDFTSPVTYTVTAEDSSTNTYTVTVTVAPSTSKSITSFDLLGIQGSINEVAKSITVTLPAGTDVTNAAPTITHTGVSITPASGVAQDFTSPITYTVTAQDGSTVGYTVTVEFADGPYVSPQQLELDLNGSPSKHLTISLGQSGNAAAQADIAVDSGYEAHIDFDQTQLTADGTVTVTGLRTVAGAGITVTFSGGDLATPTYIPVTVNVADTTVIPPTAHTITVQTDGNGTASADKTRATPGETVALSYSANGGYRFKGWEVVSGAVSISNNRFTMPDENVTIKAVFESTGGGNRGSSRSDYTQPTNGNLKVYSVNVPYTLSSNTGIFTLDLTATKLDEILGAAGSNKTIAIQTEDRLSFKEIEISFPLVWFRDHPDITFPVQTHMGGIHLNGNLAGHFPAQDKTATVSLKTGNLIFSARQDGKMVTWNSEKIPTVIYMPYTLKADEDKNAVVLYDKITDKTVAHSFYSDGKVYAAVPATGTYDVKTASVSFTDTQIHWAKEDIAFVTTHGLLSGTDGKFNPDIAITRADFLMALGRLSGADVSGYKTSTFTDVASTNPAMPYIEWAAANKIVTGIGGGKFGPDQLVTREQMAVMMTAYAQAMGQSLPQISTAATFADSDKISAWAKDAIKSIQHADIIRGRDGNHFDPQSSATRAEASTILHRFAENVING